MRPEKLWRKVLWNFVSDWKVNDWQLGCNSRQTWRRRLSTFLNFKRKSGQIIFACRTNIFRKPCRRLSSLQLMNYFTSTVALVSLDSCHSATGHKQRLLSSFGSKSKSLFGPFVSISFSLICGSLPPMKQQQQQHLLLLPLDCDKTNSPKLFVHLATDKNRLFRCLSISFSLFHEFLSLYFSFSFFFPF